jgi:hypothetical protein
LGANAGKQEFGWPFDGLIDHHYLVGIATEYP